MLAKVLQVDHRPELLQVRALSTHPALSFVVSLVGHAPERLFDRRLRRSAAQPDSRAGEQLVVDLDG